MSNNTRIFTHNNKVEPYPIDILLTGSSESCYNNQAWDITKKRVLFQEYQIPYNWLSLDVYSGYFKSNMYKELTLGFRDTIDNVERFIEDPRVFIINVTQSPLKDVYGYLPVNHPDDVIYSKGSTTCNWVNSLFIKQEYEYYLYNNEVGNVPDNNGNSSWYNSLFRRKDSSVIKDVNDDIQVDIINPDERVYDITFCINSDYYIVSEVMSMTVFDIISKKYEGGKRTYLTCDQFLDALNDLDNIKTTGQYFMRLHNLNRKYNSDKYNNLIPGEMGKLLVNLLKEKNEN
jgi:hypothetical protein